MTPRFVASASRQEVLDRRMEAGVINSGLIDIRQILKELRDKGELKQWGNKGVIFFCFCFCNFLKILFCQLLLSVYHEQI